MATSVGGVNTTPSATATTNTLGQEEFMKILLTQLTYQDPLKPMDNQEFIAQLAQFTSLEQTRQLNTKVDSLLTIQSANQAIALLNKTVEIATEAAQNVVGTVTSLRFVQGEPRLTVRRVDNSLLSDISLSQIVIVR